MSISSERVVQVWCGESKKVGSGYRVDARRVLTARHVIDESQDCHVRFDGESDYRPANQRAIPTTWRV